MTRLLYSQLRRKAFLAKWSKVDWSKLNCELADETGLSRERIRQIRQRVGAPKPTHRSRRRKTAKALQWAKDNLEKLKGLSKAELTRKYGISRYPGSALKEFLKPFVRDGRRKHRWDLMNFRLPDCDLERIWRLSRNMAGPYRFRKQLQRPTWCSRRGRRYKHFSGRGQGQAYHRTVKAEERKAARYFAKA
ncbi:MAG: hypothetical protein ACLQU3_15605 [Limisphaerales bacterium]